LEQETQKSVGEVLLDKHPPMRDPGPTAMKDYDEVPVFVDFDIKNNNNINI
jgi:hypothetical protein